MAVEGVEGENWEWIWSYFIVYMYEILKNKEELQNKSFHKTNKRIKVSILEFSSLVSLIGNTHWHLFLAPLCSICHWACLVVVKNNWPRALYQRESDEAWNLNEIRKIKGNIRQRTTPDTSAMQPLDLRLRENHGKGDKKIVRHRGYQLQSNFFQTRQGKCPH